MNAKPTAFLLVDDDELMLSLLRCAVQRAYPDACVVVAGDGQDAMERLREMAPDVVVLDLTMPGKDGFELCRAIKDDPRTASADVIAITGESTPDRIDRILTCGAQVCIEKPFQVADLLRAVAGEAPMEAMA